MLDVQRLTHILMSFVQPCKTEKAGYCYTFVLQHPAFKL